MTESVTSNLICNMLRYRSEYEGDNQVEQNRFNNIIANNMWLLQMNFAGEARTDSPF